MAPPIVIEIMNSKLAFSLSLALYFYIGVKMRLKSNRAEWRRLVIGQFNPHASDALWIEPPFAARTQITLSWNLLILTRKANAIVHSTDDLNITRKYKLLSLMACLEASADITCNMNRCQ